MNNRKKVAVIGGGSWATAIVKLLSYNLENINWYLRKRRNIEFIKKYHHNPNYITSIEFDIKRIKFYNNINRIIRNSDILIFAVPAPYLKNVLKRFRNGIKNKYIVSAIKGIVPELNMTVAEFFNKEYSVPFKNIGILTGPCHAEEIALERLSYLTISSKSIKQAEEIAQILKCHFVNVTTSTDIYGTEYAAVLKNIVAIASGISHGLGYGDNFLAVLISNAHQEIKRFLDNTYKDKRRINSSAYLGDLLVTCYSQFSRNRTFGTMIGKGYSVRSAHLEMNMVAEGYFAVKCIKEINKQYNVKMPILNAVYNILYEKSIPEDEIKTLTETLK